MNARIHLRILLMGLALFFLLGAGDTGDTGDTGEDGYGDDSTSDGCGSSPPPLLEDPSFDMWCGDSLCSWEVEEGSVEQVPTWHSGDHGVGMMTDPTVIAQHSLASSADTDCIWFSLMVDSDPGVTVQLELDFRSDGAAEYAHPIPSTDWTTFSYHIRPPDWFDVMTFRIRKTGTGNATVAQILAERDDAEMCASQTALDYSDLANGQHCGWAEECTGGYCQEHDLIASDRDIDGTPWSVCGECNWGSCDDEQVCGMAYTDDNMAYPACMDPPNKALGEQCIYDEECGSGICCYGRCSECCAYDARDCANGSVCERAPGNGIAETRMMPYMCAPSEGEREGGDPCLTGNDCASGSCLAESQLRLCDPSGQPCDTTADCPDYDGERAVCVTLGAHDGSCEDEPDTDTDTELWCAGAPVGTE